MTERPPVDAPPPVLGSWRNLYLVVLGNLAAIVLVCWFLTLRYAA